MDYILSIENLCKNYSNFSLNSINLSIPKGSIMGLIGENGAGKTTIIKLILNLIKKDKGKIEIFGQDNILYEEQLKQNMGVFLDKAYFHECLDSISINCFMKNIYKNWDSNKYFEYIKMFSLPENAKIATYSNGMRAKLNIAVTLSSNPKFLILDEPTTGLDPVVRNKILQIYSEYAKNNKCSILFSSHITTDLEKIADYVTFINNGSIVLSKSKKELFDVYCKVIIKKEDFNKLDCIKNDFSSYEANEENIILIMKKDIYNKKYSNLKLSSLTFEDIYLSLINEQHRKES